MNSRLTGAHWWVGHVPPDTGRYVVGPVRGPLIPWADLMEALPEQADLNTFTCEATPAWEPDAPGFCYEISVRLVWW